MRAEFWDREGKELNRRKQREQREASVVGDGKETSNVEPTDGTEEETANLER
jgi:hypothetical protein